MSEFEKIESDALKQIEAAGDVAALESVRVATLGKKGVISERMKELGKMGPDERKAEQLEAGDIGRGRR